MTLIYCRICERLLGKPSIDYYNNTMCRECHESGLHESLHLTKLPHSRKATVFSEAKGRKSPSTESNFGGGSDMPDINDDGEIEVNNED